MSLKAAVELSSTNQEDESTAVFEISSQQALQCHKNLQEIQLSNNQQLNTNLTLENSFFSLQQPAFQNKEDSTTLRTEQRSTMSSRSRNTLTTNGDHISLFQPIPVLHLQLKNNFHNKYDNTNFNKVPRLRQIIHSTSQNINAMKYYPQQSLLLVATRQGCIIAYLLNELSLNQLYQGYDFNGEQFQPVINPTPKQKTHLQAMLDNKPVIQQQVTIYPITSIDVSQQGYLAVGDIQGQLKVYSIQTSLKQITKINYGNEIKFVKWDCNEKHQLFVVCRQFIVYVDLLHKKQKILKIPQALTINFNSEYIFINQERQITVFSRQILDFNKQTTILKPSHIITVHSSKGKNASPQQIQYTTQTETMNELLIATKDMRTRIYSTWSGTQLQKYKGYDVKKGLQIVNINNVECDGQIKKQGILQEENIRRTNPQELIFVFKQGVISMMEKFYTSGNIIKQKQQTKKAFIPNEKYQYDVQDKLVWFDINDIIQNEQFKQLYPFIQKGYKVNIVDNIVLTQKKMQKVGEKTQYVYGIIVAMQDGTIWVFDMSP